MHSLALGASVCAHQGDGKRACHGAACWPNTEHPKRERERGEWGGSFALVFVEITQTVSVCFESRFTLTKHKKCMYNQHRRLIFTDRQFAWLCMWKEQPQQKKKKERKEKRNAESPPWLQVAAPRACAKSATLCPKVAQNVTGIFGILTFRVLT